MDGLIKGDGCCIRDQALPKLCTASSKFQNLCKQVVKKKLTKEELAAGALADWDAIIIRSATKVTGAVIKAAVAKPGSKLR
jgi:hypothetical protein